MDDPRTDLAIAYLTILIGGFIENREKLTFTPRLDALGLTLEVHADEADERLIVGKQGLIIESVRRLMTMWGRKNNARVNVYVPSRKFNNPPA